MARNLSERQLLRWNRLDREFLGWVNQRFWQHEIHTPVFIIGCGRSGTTALGHAIEQHRRITYLHEPRSLWQAAYPQTDIWGAGVTERGGRLVLTASDADTEASRRLRVAFCTQTIRCGRPVLVEKLPINSFRLNFIDAIFPDAKYIHILRDPAEVARSIARLAKPDGWYGVNDSKWNALVELARSRDEWSDLPELCDSSFRRGLLEWRLSVGLAREFFASHPRLPLLELNYSDLVEDSIEVMRQVLEFIGVQSDATTRRYAEHELSRRSAAVKGEDLADVDLRIIGRRGDDAGVRGPSPCNAEVPMVHS